MRQINVRVEDELLLGAKRRALDSGVTLTEVVQRLLAAYVEGRLVKVEAVETERGAVAENAAVPSVRAAGGVLEGDLPPVPRSVSSDEFPESEPFEDAP